MKKLKQANLYQPNPIEISGFLVERYNKCLNLLGLASTKLTKFHIDAKGWSPEIAEEKGKTHYLINGEANTHAIIISPLQNGRQVYKPFHSFDKAIMDLIFDTYENEIDDITKESAICIDFDQQIDVFYESFDLLRYDEIKIHFNLINDLEKIKNEQQELVETFNTGNNFVDEKLHQKILTSVKKYGDLRNRKLDLDFLTYKTDSFYTKAFGGVFVFKDFINTILVFESDEARNKAIKNTTYNGLIYHINDDELLEKLKDYVVIDYDLDSIIETERYKRIKKHIFSQLLKETTHPMEAILDNVNLFKNYLNKLDIDARKYLMCVERYVKRTDISNEVKITTFIYEDILEAMYEPHSSLLEDNQKLIWKLLTKIAPKDPLKMYKYDKEVFYKNYVSWNDSYQDWIINYITENNK